MPKKARTHLVAGAVWCALSVPTLLWWKDSIEWVALMMLYTIVNGEIAAFHSARAEHNSR